MNRREFIQGVSLAIAALSIPTRIVTQEAPPLNGLQVIENTQPCGADYLAVTLLWYNCNKLVSRRVVKFTRTVLKTRDSFTQHIKDRVEQEALDMEKEIKQLHSS